MTTPSGHRALSEPQFCGLVDELNADPARRGALADLLREDNPIYDQHGGAVTVRMRGWVLLALSRAGLPNSALLFALEELDNGRDAYLVAVAARALRSYAQPSRAFAPLLMRAISNIHFHDDLFCLECYGGYSESAAGTTAVREVFAALLWLGAHAHAVLPEIDAISANKTEEFSDALAGEAGRLAEAIRRAAATQGHAQGHCCAGPADLGSFRAWAPGSTGNAESIDSILFEDQDRNRVDFGQFFRGQPSVVTFFYTRCNNPRKCSLTVAKLARLQQLLSERDLADRIRTAAITYDPAFDLPDRLRGYGQSRGLRMDAGHKMLRAIDGMSTLCAHFQLGVNFVESLVNRHRVEVYVLNAAGHIVASFERLQWDEREVLAQAVALLRDTR